MPDLRIIYELTRIAYTGESVGDDWTFYVRTGAGLVSFSESVGPGTRFEARVIGVRERPTAGAEVEFERELWWASATEHDSAVPESGAGVFTPVWLPLEPGLELHRTLRFDVAEAGTWTRRGRLAHLRLEIRARVEALGDAPAPSLAATPLVPDAAVPRPERTAGELPALFEVALEGVDVDDLPVIAEQTVLVNRESVGGDPRAEALARFLTHFAGGFLPAWYEPRAAIYELRNRDDQGFWIGRNSSMGQRNNRKIIEAFAEAAPPLGSPIADEAGGFEERRSLLIELLADVHTVELGPSADAIAQLIHALVDQYPERATVEREVHVRTALIDEISGEWTRAFIVDPRPYSGPDRLAYLVVWTDSWTE